MGSKGIKKKNHGIYLKIVYYKHCPSHTDLVWRFYLCFFLSFFPPASVVNSFSRLNDQSWTDSRGVGGLSLGGWWGGGAAAAHRQIYMKLFSGSNSKVMMMQKRIQLIT